MRGRIIVVVGDVKTAPHAILEKLLLSFAAYNSLPSAIFGEEGGRVLIALISDEPHMSLVYRFSEITEMLQVADEDPIKLLLENAKKTGGTIIYLPSEAQEDAKCQKTT